MAYRSRNDLLSHILTDDEVDRLISLWKQGQTIKQISTTFNVHENTVSNIIGRYVQQKRTQR